MTKTIKKLLIDKDMTMLDLARKIGKSRVWTSYVVNGHMKSPKVRKAIAKVLEVNVEDLWEQNNGRAA
jgi:DNA-binding Xre family transcriptional regulator